MFGRAPDAQKIMLRRFILRRSYSHDPFRNLSLEESLFSLYDPPIEERAEERAEEEIEMKRGADVLFLYVNRAAVVIGRHQNPWQECNLSYLFERDIPLLRRYSGGGTVFHDLGNLLWSFIGPKRTFSQEENLQIIMEAAADYSGLPLSDFVLSPRGDIFCQDFKISGNALAFKGGKVMHHGTLLVNSDIGLLEKSLEGLAQQFNLRFTGPAVSSRPAAVRSLSSLAPHAGLPHSATMLSGFASSVENILQHKSAAVWAEGSQNEPLQHIYEQQRSIDWRLRSSPPCRMLLHNGRSLSVQGGRVSVDDGRDDGRSWDIATSRGLKDFKNYLRTDA